MLILQIRCSFDYLFILKFVEIAFSFFFFSLSHFLFFFIIGKYGETPLYIAAQEGHEQIVDLFYRVF